MITPQILSNHKQTIIDHEAKYNWLKWKFYYLLTVLTLVLLYRYYYSIPELQLRNAAIFNFSIKYLEIILNLLFFFAVSLLYYRTYIYRAYDFFKDREFLGQKIRRAINRNFIIESVLFIFYFLALIQFLALIFDFWGFKSMPNWDLFLFFLGIALSHKIFNRKIQSFFKNENLFEILPTNAHIRNDSHDRLEIPTKSVMVNQIIIVRPQERIPLDGEILEGNSKINEEFVSGDLLRHVKIGSHVFAGTLNLENNLTIKVTRKFNDSLIYKEIFLSHKSYFFVSPWPKFFKFMAENESSLMLLFAGIFSSIAIHGFDVSILNSIILGLAIIFSYPPHFLATMYFAVIRTTLIYAKQNGVVFKNQNSLKNLYKYKTIVFYINSISSELSQKVNNLIKNDHEIIIVTSKAKKELEYDPKVLTIKHIIPNIERAHLSEVLHGLRADGRNFLLILKDDPE